MAAMQGLDEGDRPAGAGFREMVRLEEVLGEHGDAGGMSSFLGYGEGRLGCEMLGLQGGEPWLCLDSDSSEPKVLIR